MSHWPELSPGPTSVQPVKESGLAVPLRKLNWGWGVRSCLLQVPVLRSLHANTWHAAKLLLHAAKLLLRAQVHESTVGIISSFTDSELFVF